MSIEINLLPPKPKENKPLLLTSIVLSACFIVLTISGIIYSRSLQNEVTQLVNQTETVRLTQEMILSQQEDSVSSNLSSIVSEIENERVLVINWLDNTVAALPDQTRFSSFEYSSDDQINIDVLAADRLQVSSYLYNLQALNNIDQFNLSQVELVADEEDEREFFASFQILLNSLDQENEEEVEEDD